MSAEHPVPERDSEGQITVPLSFRLPTPVLICKACGWTGIYMTCMWSHEPYDASWQVWAQALGYCPRCGANELREAEPLDFVHPDDKSPTPPAGSAGQGS